MAIYSDSVEESPVYRIPNWETADTSVKGRVRQMSHAVSVAVV